MLLRATIVRVGLGAGVGWFFAYAIQLNISDFFQFGGWFKVYEILCGAVVGLIWSWVALPACLPLDLSNWRPSKRATVVHPATKGERFESSVMPDICAGGGEVPLASLDKHRWRRNLVRSNHTDR